MRLIDADLIKNVFDLNTWQGDMIKSIVDNSPTAYDVEKVIKKLEECKCSKEDAEREIDIYMRNLHIDICINIVKGGGIDG